MNRRQDSSVTNIFCHGALVIDACVALSLLTMAGCSRMGYEKSQLEVAIGSADADLNATPKNAGSSSESTGGINWLEFGIGVTNRSESNKPSFLSCDVFPNRLKSIAVGGSVLFQARFVNTSDQICQITRVTTSCTCTTPVRTDLTIPATAHLDVPLVSHLNGIGNVRLKVVAIGKSGGAVDPTAAFMDIQSDCKCSVEPQIVSMPSPDMRVPISAKIQSQGWSFVDRNMVSSDQLLLHFTVNANGSEVTGYVEPRDSSKLGRYESILLFVKNDRNEHRALPILIDSIFCEDKPSLSPIVWVGPNDLGSYELSSLFDANQMRPWDPSSMIDRKPASKEMIGVGRNRQSGQQVIVVVD